MSPEHQEFIRRISRPLKEQLEEKPRACIRSGWCCKRGPCPFGEWDAARHQCRFLGGDKPGDHFCMKYDEIVKDPSSRVSPAFGGGCCSSLNSDRIALVIESGVEVFVE